MELPFERNIVKRCVIKGCKSGSYVGCGISFFKLPNDEPIKAKWFKIIPSSVPNQSVICSRHFKPEDIIIHSNSKAKLRPSAVPSIFPKGPEMASVEVKDESIRNEQLYPLLKNIIDKCKSEAKYKALHIPLEKYEARVSYYTGIPREVVQEISNEIKTSSFAPDKISMNLTQRILIYDALRNFYEQGETPSYKDIHEALEKNENFPELTQFTEQMEAMGFDYKRLVNGKMLLMEDPKNTFERCLFLKKIKKIRSSSSQIYYIDERIIDKKLSFKKPWLQNIDKHLFETENIFIFFHVVSYCDGVYVAEGLFCNQGSESDFQKWIVEILVNNIKPASTILMDKSPLHGVYKDNTISRYHPKEHMLKWLKENDIPCTANMNKAQLYELIRKCPSIDKQFSIDRILKAHGHNVLRLPTNFHDLSLTEFMWKYLSTRDIYYTEGLEWETIQSKILEQIKKITPDTWHDFVKTTEKFEDDILHIDAEIEKTLENYQFIL